MLCLLRWPRAPGGKLSKEPSARRGEGPLPPAQLSASWPAAVWGRCVHGGVFGAVRSRVMLPCGLQREASMWGLLWGGWSLHSLKLC